MCCDLRLRGLSSAILYPMQAYFSFDKAHCLSLSSVVTIWGSCGSRIRDKVDGGGVFLPACPAQFRKSGNVPKVHETGLPNSCQGSSFFFRDLDNLMTLSWYGCKAPFARSLSFCIGYITPCRVAGAGAGLPMPGICLSLHCRHSIWLKQEGGLLGTFCVLLVLLYSKPLGIFCRDLSYVWFLSEILKKCLIV